MSPVATDIPKRAHSAVNSWREVRNAINVLNQRIDEVIPGAPGVTAPDDPAYLLENFADGSYGLLPNRRRLVGGTNVTLSDGGAAGDLTINAASGAVDSVFGRTGAVVATEGDYDIDELGDVDTVTAAPVVNDVLTWNGLDWVPGTASHTHPASEITDFEVEKDRRTYVTVTANYTVLVTDDVVLLDATDNDITATLPGVVVGAGKNFDLKRIDQSSNTVTVVPS